jgi:hypothetical protein
VKSVGVTPSFVEAEAAELIRRWNDELPQPVSVRLVRSHDKRGEALLAFLRTFTSLANKVHFSPLEGREGELPAILLGTSVRWQAMPEGRELMPFLKTIEMHSSPGYATVSVPEALRSQIESVSLPADLKIYVTPQCPFCPHVLSEIVPLSVLNPVLHLAVIDGALFPELAAGDGVRSVPSVILDGAFRWTGAGHMDEIVNAILNRDPARLGSKSLEDFIKEGNAGALARMMIDLRQVFPAFTDLFEGSEWSIRLGAMVVVEEIAEKSPELLEEMLDLLWSRLHGISGPARGDVMYLFGLGQPGSKLWIDRLKGILENEDEEGREVVMEALEKLHSQRTS